MNEWSWIMTKIDAKVVPKSVEMANSSSSTFNGGSRRSEHNHVNTYSHPYYGSLENPSEYRVEPQRSWLNRCCGFSVRNNTPISPIRRTFLLVVLFDLFVCTVLWLIYTEVRTFGPDKSNLNPFYNQVVNYSFKTSLFDTVLLSLIRFVILQLFYALLRASKPWSVAFTTLGSSAFLIAKVVRFKYDGEETALEILVYIVLIASLVIPWVETWLLDLKVLPRELRDYERLHSSHNDHSHESPSLPHRPSSPAFHSPEGSVDSFSGSDDNHSFHSAFSPRSRSESLTTLNDLESTPKEKIQAAESYALNALHEDGWTLKSGKDEKGVIYSKSDDKYGKLFKMVAVFDIPALTFYNDQIENVEDMPKWNPTVSEQKVIQTIDDHTDIIYNVGAEQLGGVVSSRDFVFVRQYRQVDGCYLISSVSIELDSMPEKSPHVRGEQGPGVLKLTDVNGNQTKLEWVLNTNLKGWLFQSVIDQALSSVLMTYLEYMRKHCVELKQQAES